MIVRSSQTHAHAITHTYMHSVLPVSVDPQARKKKKIGATREFDHTGDIIKPAQPCVSQ